MSLLARFLSGSVLARQSPENPSTSLANPASWLLDFFGSAQTASGSRVNETSAMGLPVVYACIRVPAETIGSIPVRLVERQGRARREAEDHPLNEMIRRRPNGRHTSCVFRELTQAHVDGWGNAYAEIQIDGAGRTTLHPMHPAETEPYIPENSRDVWYRHVDRGKPRAIPANRVVHIPGLGFDGLRGKSPIRVAREAVGLGLAAQTFGASWFGSGSRPSGILSHPQTLSDPAYERIKRDVARHTGLGNANKLMLLEEGLTWQQVTVPPDDAQFIETGKFNVEQIARIFRMQLHKIQSMDRATFSNIEHQAIEHVTDTIRPRCVKIEEEWNRKLLSPEEQTRYAFKFNLEGLLRGDVEARFRAYAIGRQWGWLSADDVLELEDRNPLPDRQGEIYLIPMNMIPAEDVDRNAERGGVDDRTVELARELARCIHGDRAGVELAAAGAGAPDRDATTPAREERQAAGPRIRRALEDSNRPIFEDAGRRLVARETRAVRRAIKRYLDANRATRPGPEARDAAGFREWLDGFYDGHEPVARRAIGPAVATLADQIAAAAVEELGADPVDRTGLETFAARYVEAFSVRHVRSSRGQLTRILDETDEAELGDELLRRVDEWDERRAGKIGRREVRQLGSAVARWAFAGAGVLALRWVAVGKNCPICEGLDGRTVSVESNFADAGDSLGGDAEGKGALDVRQGFSHPPAHDGCDCMIVPG